LAKHADPQRPEAMIAGGSALVAAGATLLATGPPRTTAGIIVLSVGVASILGGLGMRLFGKTASATVFTVVVMAGFGVAVGISRSQHKARADACQPANAADSAPAVVYGHTRSPVRLVQLSALEMSSSEGQGCLNIDVKLRNVGSQRVFIAAAALHVDRAWDFRTECGGKGGGTVPLAANYDVRVNLTHIPTVATTTAVAQQIGPNDVDDFGLRAEFAGYHTTRAILKIHLVLTYDENQATLVSPAFLVLIQPGSGSFSADQLPPGTPLALGANRRLIRSLPPLARSGGVQQLSHLILTRRVAICV
jgi:hypothetical protein